MTRQRLQFMAVVLSLAIGIAASVALRTAFSERPAPLLVAVHWWI